MKQFIIILFLLFFCLGCNPLRVMDDFSGGYRYCEECDVQWHTYYGETHKCEWGTIVKNREGNVKETKKE